MPLTSKFQWDKPYKQFTKRIDDFTSSDDEDIVVPPRKIKTGCS